MISMTQWLSPSSRRAALSRSASTFDTDRRIVPAAPRQVAGLSLQLAKKASDLEGNLLEPLRRHRYPGAG
jgi:hypothetical protein